MPLGNITQMTREERDLLGAADRQGRTDQLSPPQPHAGVRL